MAPRKTPLVAFDFDGESYSIPKAEEWSLDAIEAFEDGKIATLIREILGAEQWRRFKAKPRKIADLSALFETAQEAMESGN